MDAVKQAAENMVPKDAKSALNSEIKQGMKDVLKGFLKGNS